MNIEKMETPMTRSEFEHRFHILENKIKNGNMHIPRAIYEKSLLKLRRLPNGRLDFLSVDELARVQANMIFKMSKLDSHKELSSNDPSTQPQKED